MLPQAFHGWVGVELFDQGDLGGLLSNPWKSVVYSPFMYKILSEVFKQVNAQIVAVMLSFYKMLYSKRLAFQKMEHFAVFETMPSHVRIESVKKWT